MKHLKKFENFETNEGLKGRFTSTRKKLKDKVSKVRNLSWDDVKKFGNKAWDFMKRESNETKQAANILKKMMAGKDVTENEKKFLREQSKDLVKIIGTSALPIPITAVLVALGKKYNFEVFPGDQEKLKELIKKEKEDLGLSIEGVDEEE